MDALYPLHYHHLRKSSCSDQLISSSAFLMKRENLGLFFVVFFFSSCSQVRTCSLLSWEHLRLSLGSQAYQMFSTSQKKALICEPETSIRSDEAVQQEGEGQVQAVEKQSLGLMEPLFDHMYFLMAIGLIRQMLIFALPWIVQDAQVKRPKQECFM